MLFKFKDILEEYNHIVAESNPIMPSTITAFEEYISEYYVQIYDDNLRFVGYKRKGDES